MKEIIKKRCIACNELKYKKEYYKSKKYIDGYMSRCKICYKEKIFLENDHSSFAVINLGQIYESSFKDMKDILRSIGYDTDRDIHQQFIERMENKYGVKFEYQPEAEDNIYEFKKKLNLE